MTVVTKTMTLIVLFSLMIFLVYITKPNVLLVEEPFKVIAKKEDKLPELTRELLQSYTKGRDELRAFINKYKEERGLLKDAYVKSLQVKDTSAAEKAFQSYLVNSHLLNLARIGVKLQQAGHSQDIFMGYIRRHQESS